MERNYINEFLDALHNGLGFTYLSNEGGNMKKHELIDIAKELVYAIEDANLLEIDKKEIFSIADENLRE